MQAAGFHLLLDQSNKLLGLRALLILQTEGFVLQSKFIHNIENIILTSHRTESETFGFPLFTSITFSFFFTSAFLLAAGTFFGGILT
jgi:hypothetical protein